MYFSVCVGSTAEYFEWLNRTLSYTNLLNLKVNHNCIKTQNDLCIGLASIFSQNFDNKTFTEKIITTKEDHEEIYINLKRLTSSYNFDRTQFKDDYLKISKLNGNIEINNSLFNTEQIYFLNQKSGYIIGNDFRLMLKHTNFTIDKTGVYSLLKYGTHGTFNTLCENIKSVPNGFIFKASPQNPNQSSDHLLEISPDQQNFFELEDSPHNTDEYLNTLENILNYLPDESALFFSGGVDSGFLAYKLMELNKNHIPLINFSFGPDDYNGKISAQMAKDIKMPFHQITYQKDHIYEFIENLFKLYSIPFFDASQIPTGILVQRTLKNFPQINCIIDGIGPDQYLGGGYSTQLAQWQNIYKLPKIFGNLGFLLNTRDFAWKLPYKKTTILRILHKFHQNSFEEIPVINYCNGITYNIPENTDKLLSQNFNKYVNIFASPLKNKNDFYSVQMIMCDLVLKIMLKSYEPLRYYGVNSISPFMHPRAIKKGLSINWSEKFENRETKAVLKKYLKSQMPPGQGVIPKMGFITPLELIIQDKTLLNYIMNIVLADDNPIGEFVNLKTFKRIISHVSKNNALNPEMSNNIWGIVFLSIWLKQLNSLNNAKSTATEQIIRHNANTTT